MNDTKEPEPVVGRGPLCSSPFAVLYRDEGPIGIVPQCSSVTGPHSSIHLFEDEESMRAWLLDYKIPRRRNPSIYVFYPEGHDYCDNSCRVVFHMKEKSHPMLCFHHGGSDACERINEEHGFTCPKCKTNASGEQQPGDSTK